jgi:subtilisin family serine protease
MGKSNKYLLTIVCLFFFVRSLPAQVPELSARLNEMLINENVPESGLRILIVFTEQIDIEAFKMESIDVTTVGQNAKKLISNLQQTALSSQNDFLNRYGFNADNFQILQHFWIVNAIEVSALPSVIKVFETDRRIRFMQLSNEQHAVLIQPVKVGRNDNGTEALNSAEQGLVAINLRPMWKLGYTGRGQKVFSYDTGINPNHPAIGSRFLGRYQPLKQSWFPQNNTIPSDILGHGTHVTGIMTGLDTANHDTIGAAMNAYFMACDAIRATPQELPSIGEIMAIYQWALNPDGDTSTTDDIPDVINNSWRWYDVPDTLYCDDFIKSMLRVIEIAGIANVYSAGNFGPNNTTISSPQRAVNNELNSFTVGSINGNQANWPISNFSSRGPTQCNATGSMKIKPEVVAPGQTVRSAYFDDYDFLSGTSMASPHVAGAVLVLKEAFPYLSGSDILNALYQTAVDLGVPGEDNVYGRGMIDVYAAFDFLKQNHTPVPPNQSKYDLAVQSIINPGFDFTCDSIIVPEIVLGNYGDSIINKAIIEYSLNEDTVFQFLFNGALKPGQLDTLALPAIKAETFGLIELIVNALTDTALFKELEYVNNSLAKRFTIRKKDTLPYFEKFNYANLNQSNFDVYNPNFDVRWTIFKDFPVSCVLIDFPAIKKREGQLDGLNLPTIDMPDSGKITLTFDYAYKTKNVVFADKLEVLASIDCGDGFDFPLFSQSGIQLNTHQDAVTDPKNPAHWKNVEVDLSQFSGEGELAIQFLGTNDWGGILYLDNIKIVHQINTGIPGITIGTFEIRPNPAHTELILEILDYDALPVAIEIFDLNGKQLYSEAVGHLSGPNVNIPVSRLVAGMYIIRIQTKTGNWVQKFIKQ